MLYNVLDWIESVRTRGGCKKTCWMLLWQNFILNRYLSVNIFSQNDMQIFLFMLFCHRLSACDDHGQI